MNNTYDQRNEERSLEKAQNCYHHENDKEKAKDHYENNKERLQERVRNKFSNEEKVMKREYGRN